MACRIFCYRWVLSGPPSGQRSVICLHLAQIMTNITSPPSTSHVAQGHTAQAPSLSNLLLFVVNPDQSFVFPSFSVGNTAR